MTLKQEYEGRAGGNTEIAAAAFALDLMEGDDTRFKAGYSLANAVIAAAEVFGIERATVEAHVALVNGGKR